MEKDRDKNKAKREGTKLTEKEGDKLMNNNTIPEITGRNEKERERTTDCEMDFTRSGQNENERYGMIRKGLNERARDQTRNNRTKRERTG